MNKTLPPEVLKEVFTHLPKSGCFKNIRLVCREWYRISQIVYPVVLYISTPDNISFNNLLFDFENYPAFNSKIKRLVITQLKEDFAYSDDKFFSLVQSIPNLKQVELRLSPMYEKFARIFDQLTKAVVQKKEFAVKCVG
jgi:hypothetical protein